MARTNVTTTTTTEVQENFNFNPMRNVLLLAYSTGNKKAITKKFCEQNGLSANQYAWYDKRVKGLFAAVSDYCRLKNSPNINLIALGKAEKAIAKEWAKFLDCGEVNNFSKELHANPHDVSNLVGFCQTFIDNKNDISLGENEDFQAQKSWAIQSEGKFRRYIETDIGIRIAGIEVMDNDTKDFLMAERALLRNIKGLRGNIAAIDERIAAYAEDLEGVEGDAAELKAYIAQKVEALNEKKAEYLAEIKGLAEKHTALVQEREKALANA